MFFINAHWLNGGSFQRLIVFELQDILKKRKPCKIFHNSSSPNMTVWFVFPPASNTAYEQIKSEIKKKGEAFFVA